MHIPLSIMRFLSQSSTSRTSTTLASTKASIASIAVTSSALSHLRPVSSILLASTHSAAFCTPSAASMNRSRVIMASNATADAPKPHVALLGVGLMGNKMAQRLRSLGFPVTVWNRTAAKSQPLEALGCAVAPSAAAAVAAADVTLLMLADADAIEAVLLKDASTMSALGGKTIVQMGTIGPKQAQAIAAAVEAAGAAFLEAPVLGSQPEATAGTLLIMVGCAGDMTASPAFPVLLAFGSKISYMGAVGTAAASKLALNQLIGALTVGFSTSLAMVQKNDVDLDKWMGILRESALYAPTYDKKLDKYLSRSYGVANFPLVHLRKDVRLFAEEATKAACDTTFLRSMEGLCEEAVARGFGYADYSAVYEAVVEPVRAGESITPEA